MKLRDLDAQFVTNVTVKGYQRMDADTVEGAQGVMFQCPSCGAGKPTVTDQERHIGAFPRRYVAGAHYIMVLFRNPRGVEPAPANAGPTASDGTHHRWTTVSGTTLDDLTLSPSINCDVPWTDENGVEHPSSCKFHGFVKNGDAS